MGIVESVLCTGLVGLSVWVFTTNAKVSVMEANHKSLKELILSKLSEMNARLGRIERVMNGHLPRD